MWIESHQSLRNHPKVKKAARIAGVSECEMIGLLHYLWWWSMDYAPDGDLTKYTDADIEDAVDWKGERGLFVKSLVECSFNGHSGLIDVGTKKNRKIHDWYEYAGKLIERRAEDAERKRNARRKPSTGHPQDGDQTAYVPNQPTIPNQQNKQKPPKSAAKPPTPPQIEAYRRAAHRYPNKSLYSLICQHVKDDSTSLDLFEKIITGWIAMGWNPANINGILEFVDRGEVPHRNGQNGNGKKPAFDPRVTVSAEETDRINDMLEKGLL